MRRFNHIDVETVDAAASILAEYDGKAKLIAGGTDLLDTLKNEVVPDYPEVLINLKTISGLNQINEEGNLLRIGALATLAEVAENATVKSKYSSLAQAAYSVGSPQLRNVGTIAGNLCQEVRCWYYRAANNYFYCFRKGGTLCNAVAGDSRYNAILGGQVCFAVCPSDTAIALEALNATVVTNKRQIPIEDFFVVLGNILGKDEIVTEVQVPTPESGIKQSFIKYSIRKTFDFAISSVSTAIKLDGNTVSDARIVLGAAAPIPYRALDAEAALKGNSINESTAEAASSAAVKDATPLLNNAYLIQITKSLVKRAIVT